MPTNALTLRKLAERSERVFPSHPQVTHYFAASAIEDARKRLGRAIERGDGPGLVIGLPGTGKSLLLQALAAQYHERFDVVLLACARLCSRRALFQAILFELGLAYQQRDEGGLRLGLMDHLLSSEKCPSGLLLLVDEAQTLSTALLDELRVLTNLVRAGAPRVRLVLAGSSALEESFAHPELESFSQRLSARCYLSPLNRDETSRLIQAQVAAAGVMPNEIFAADAWDAIFDATDGVARLVNQLCDRALTEAVAAGRERIDQHIIQQAWSGLQQLPTPWEVPVTKAAESPAPQIIEFGQLRAEAPVAGSIKSFANDSEWQSDESMFDIEPTELDVENEVAYEKPVAALQASRSPAAIAAPNPFAEDFAEEEVVLDNFAAWDNLFRRDTPRVQNRRDPGFAARVQSAVASLATTKRGEFASQVEESVDVESDWPPLRLAVVSESLPPNVTSSRGTTSPTTGRYAEIFDRMLADGDADQELQSIASAVGSAIDDVANDDDEVPVLIIDDEPLAPRMPTAPVRREEYRHLFSRLRSG